MRKGIRITLAVLFGISGILAASLAASLHNQTIVDAHWPLLISLLCAAPPAYIFQRFMSKITLSGSSILNYSLSLLWIAAIMIGSFYCINYNASRPDADNPAIKATVTRKYSKTRHRSRRSGRRVISSGETYKVYYMDVRLPDERDKTIRIPIADYNRVHKGDSLSFDVERGLLGFTVIKNLSPTIDRTSRRDAMRHHGRPFRFRHQ